MDKKIDEGVLQWFSHVERIENNRIPKRFYVGEFAGRVRKRGIDTMKDCLKKRVLDVRQARRILHDSVWCGDDLTLTRCHSCELPQLYEALEGRKSVCGQAHNLSA